ncbi:FAD-binding domain-containing protein [Penicillium sp. DV-2018c]|nr:FAD-binding domain-containing protein [Penicillium sp. DV-2018c]KAJ5559222.1 FAD-binding domain-containing protein [Penicillium sp. DV-2018c]
MDQLRSFLAQHPYIHHASPSSPDFETLREAFIIKPTVPAMIVQPRSAEDVAGLLRVLKENDLPFTIRVGGHDMFGRSQVQDAITIDLREIAYIHVDRDNLTARLGGGVLFVDLIKELARDGLVVPHPLVAAVGYVGWATHAGYGLLTPQFGLGADQILQAKVVDAQAVIRDADEDMLTAIRGGGGALGIIVELTIKVYPLGQILAGTMILESSDLPATIRRYNEAYRQQGEEGLPAELNVQQCILNGPAGKAMAIFFFWGSSDMDAGQKWLSKVNTWSPVIMSTVAPTTVAAFHESIKDVLPKAVYGQALTASFRKLTPEVVEVISKHALLQPRDPATLISIHELRDSAPEPSERSVFGTRCPHFVLEIIPCVLDKSKLDETLAWGYGFHDDMMRIDAENLLSSTFIALTEPSKANMRKIYGKQYETLARLKKQYDPANIFKLAVVQL